MKGHPAVLFFFCGCPACQKCARSWATYLRSGVLKSSPFHPTAKEYPETVVVYSGDATAVKQFARQTGLTGPHVTLLTDTDMAATHKYGVDPCPRVFVTDRLGSIKYTNNGADDAPQKNDESVIVARALTWLRVAATSPTKMGAKTWGGAKPATAGGGGDSRVVLLCDPNLPRSERTMDRQFRTECIAPPGPLTDPSDIYYLGNASTDFYYTNGYMNHDITLFKNFSFAGGKNLQIRVEMYNAPNLNQFTVVDTSAQFDYATGEQTDTESFGHVTGTRSGSARVIQLGARFTF